MIMGAFLSQSTPAFPKSPYTSYLFQILFGSLSTEVTQMDLFQLIFSLQQSIESQRVSLSQSEASLETVQSTLLSLQELVSP